MIVVEICLRIFLLFTEMILAEKSGLSPANLIGMKPSCWKTCASEGGEIINVVGRRRNNGDEWAYVIPAAAKPCLPTNGQQ